ncbi:MAG: hypothetical protein ACK4FS_11455 [Flavobacterium sp.]
MKITTLLFISILFISCNRKITTEISNKIIELKSENGIPTDFKKLDQYIANKEIILLGEAAHGEGKTWEVKTQLVKYLIEEKGFNTIALEGMDFLQMEYINGRSELKNNLTDNFDSVWYKFWNPWNPAKQLIPFEKFIKSSKISFLGIEPYQYSTAMINISFIKNELEKSNWAILNKNEYLEIASIFEKIFTKKSNLSIEEFDFFLFQLENFIEENELVHFHDNFFTQMVENLITHVKTILS